LTITTTSIKLFSAKKWLKEGSMTKEVQYKPCDWCNYNKALLERGRLTLWFDLEDIQKWYASNDNLTGSGSTRTYSDWAIEMLHVFRFIFNMPLRAVAGFAESLFELMKIDLIVPHYSTLCRRLGHLSIELVNTLSRNEAIHLPLDSTGLKVYGEGEWKVRQHGYTKRRTWRKVHIAIDVNSQQIMNVVVSTNDFKDNEVIGKLLNGIEQPIGAIYADGAYDANNVYAACDKEEAKAVIPPRKDAKIKQHGNSKKW